MNELYDIDIYDNESHVQSMNYTIKASMWWIEKYMIEQCKSGDKTTW